MPREETDKVATTYRANEAHASNHVAYTPRYLPVPVGCKVTACGTDVTVKGETVLPGILAIVLLTCLSAVHVYWACGGRTGFVAAIPEAQGKPTFHPGTGATLLVAALLLLAAFTVAGQLRFWGSAVPTAWFLWGTRGLALTFLFRVIGDFRYVGLFKRVRGTRFAVWDTWLFVPLCLIIAVCSFYATGQR